MSARRFEVLMTGVGGKGVLTAGQLLAQAGMAQYRHVLWFPSYQAAMRGGPCECTVVLSDEEIASPILTETQSLVVMEPSQLKPFEHRLIPGGLLLVEEAGFSGECRRDVRLAVVPAVATAVRLGNPQAANLVLLGAYLELTQAIPLELVEKELERRFRGQEGALKLNREAFYLGAELASKFGGRP